MRHALQPSGVCAARFGYSTPVSTRWEEKRRLEKHMAAEAASVAPLRHAVVAFARGLGASEIQCDDIGLAVSEAVSNVVLHAYEGRESPGTVSVVASVHEQSLRVVVCDEGAGLHARHESPGLGAGLTIIGRVTEQLQIEPLAPGVRLRMTFALC